MSKMENRKTNNHKRHNLTTEKVAVSVSEQEAWRVWDGKRWVLP